MNDHRFPWRPSPGGPCGGPSGGSASARTPPETRWRLFDHAGRLLDVIELRVLTPDDWATWRHLRLAALTEAPAAFGSRLADWRGDGDRIERWRARLDIPGSCNLAATLDGRPVGMASGVPTDEPGVVELISMWVDPIARGRDIGNHLVAGVERWARQVRADMLRLAVAPDNPAAATLYRRNGFHLTGELGEPISDGAHRTQIMVKNLLTDRPTP